MNSHRSVHFIVGTLRIFLGWILLWAFFDKVFGLGFATAPEKSWIDGVSPTTGFLRFGLEGTFAWIFQPLAGRAWVDWMFMIGLLGLGFTLILGIGIRIAGVAGIILMLLLWLAVFPSEHNPIIDEHVMYALLLLLFVVTNAGDYLGLGSWWKNTHLVQRFPFLR